MNDQENVLPGPQQGQTPSGAWNGHGQTIRTPASASSSNNTYLMPTSPSKRARTSRDSYKPKISRTCGQRPACLVNASVTYCGNNQIYAFGGFDQYTDEVYNHVLKLDLETLQWTLVDNYGDIPGVRMGHTACLWQGSKLLVYGGENEHREYLSDLVIYDIKTSFWTQPEVRGTVPKGRARHAAAVYDDKLFVVGGLAGTDTYTLDEICYLDLRTWTWSRSWSFIARFDHSTWIWGGRIWVYGGLGPDMERSGELFSLDLKSSPAFRSVSGYGLSESTQEKVGPSPRSHFGQYNQHQHVPTGSSGYTANSSSVQIRNTSLLTKPVAPGAISSTKFISGPNVPSPALGTHFHVYSSGALLDFVTPAGTIRPSECSLSTLELNDQQWQKLADGPDIFDPSYRWHYCAVDENGTKAWLLGCALESNDGAANFEEYLSDVIALDLREYGLLGNGLSWEPGTEKSKPSAFNVHPPSKSNRLGADLACMFDRHPESGSGNDFVITANREDAIEDEGMSPSSSMTASSQGMGFVDASVQISPPIYVHKLILQARWPHFNRVYNAQMSEFHSRKLHIDEPYSVVRAFLYYLYTDSIERHSEYCPSLAQVAGLLVMSDVYDMPLLRLQCVHRLSRELDVEHAAVIWERAGTANEEWLRRRAAIYCLTHWGRVVRTAGFRSLSRRSLIELHEVIDVDGRVIGGEELEVVGGFGGGKLGFGGSGSETARRRAKAQGGHGTDEVDDNEIQDDEGMEIN
ncbi:hypothetical protein ACLMJK_008310 [Lecanora helva]